LLFETDVNLGKVLGGVHLVYRPEIVFIAAPRAAQVGKRIEMVPDLVIEIISPDSRSLDSETKFHDYERAGVRECWLFDPLEERSTIFRHVDGRFVEVAPAGEVFESEAVPGFWLSLAKVRAAFRAA
jgi:Uma2 family endonuclease